jgi:hypothetical protein
VIERDRSISAGEGPFTWRRIHFTFDPCEDCGTSDMDVIACSNVTGFCLDCCGCDHDGTHGQP